MLQAPLIISLGIFKHNNELKFWKICYECCNLFPLKWNHSDNRCHAKIRVKVNILYSFVDCGKLAGKRGGTGGTAHSTGEKASAQTVSDKGY